MDAEAESDTQRRRMHAKSSSIKRKPLANLTNIIHKPQSKKPATSTASNSSIGSTQNPIHLPSPIRTPPGQHVPSEPQRLATDCLVGDENRNSVGQRQSTRNTKSNTKDAVNSSCLDKTKNDGQILYKRKAIDVPLSAHHTKNASNSVNTPLPNSTTIKYTCLSKNTKDNVDTPLHRSTMNSNDKGKTIDEPHRSVKNVKSNMVEPRVPLKGVIIKDKGDMVVGSNHADVAKKFDGKADVTSNSVINRKDKGKAIAVPDDYLSTKYRKFNMFEDHVPLKGIIIKDRSETVSGSNHADRVQKDDRTPVSYRTLEKKDKRSSCPPPLRSTSNRNDVVGSEDIVQLKAQTEPPPNKKKRRCSSKQEYTLPQEFVEQQRAYFKEIDDFELLVEEV